MSRVGIAHLPMHWGKAPRWLFSRMAKLAREITIAIISEYGPEEMLKRLSDPYWFQAFGCILGYDWHSSGLTTVTCGALKEGLKGIEKDLNFFVAGGKGGTSRKTPGEIIAWADKTNLQVNPEKLIYASKMSAKVDSSAIQDGYQLYHHNFFFTTKGSWAVIQQGMPRRRSPACSLARYCGEKQYARRYHWLSDKIKSFTNEPQTGICDNKKFATVLNLTSQKSTSARKVIAEIARVKPHKILAEYKRIGRTLLGSKSRRVPTPATQNMSILTLPKREWIEYSDIKPQNLEKVLISTYENQPQNFEELLGMKGVGPKSVRAFTLISELTFGTKADWEDPVKYSFAHGGKDGYPYPVDKETYDKSIGLLKKAVEKAKIERNEKKNALIRLFKDSQT